MKTSGLPPATTSRASATTLLLYWLLILCGLEGLTVLRLHTSAANDLALGPLWLGTVLGVALGQFLAWFRVRAWVPALVTVCSVWFLPLAFYLLYEAFGNGAETCALAFFPAAICGYFSLSERGALVSFWYPAVLWMLVILDGRSSTAGPINASTTLPFVVGLAALFVAFLRARETRRVAIWRTHGTVRIAEAKKQTVLRKSPGRAAWQHAWMCGAGAGALVLATWIAPHLWQKDPGKTRPIVTQASSANVYGDGSGAVSQAPCCAEQGFEQDKRVREYFPLVRGHDREQYRDSANSNSCQVCRNGNPIAQSDQAAHPFGQGGYAYQGGVPALFNDPYGIGGTTTSTTTTTTTTTGSGNANGIIGNPYYGGDNNGRIDSIRVDVRRIDPVAPLPVNPSPATAPTPPTVKTTVATTTPTGTTPSSSSPGIASKHEGPQVVIATTMPVKSTATPPWRLAMIVSVLALGLHVLVRATRRHITLRHLHRPFWSETLDQRISNHWQRVLIGLGDAGIHPTTDEQPHALARRVGIAGMETCATILERVRHGVRVDEADLETMDSAASAIYRTAREKAGITGRATAWLRWPFV
jgi:hypothetical protein